MKLDTIGLTAEGRPQLMAIISSPANLARLEEYRRTSETLARGRVDSATARRLAASGKAVVWIDGGLHADEVLGANQLLELVWQFTSMNDPETLRILNDVIILAVQVNPDGMELVADWYMRNPDSLRRSTGGLPRLYEKYAGHDDNRDWYRNALPETRNGDRIQYRDLVPADHLQPSPDRPDRLGDVHAAVPRPVQLLLRSAHPDLARLGRRWRCSAASPPKARAASSTRTPRPTPPGGTAACARPATSTT